MGAGSSSNRPHAEQSLQQKKLTSYTKPVESQRPKHVRQTTMSAPLMDMKGRKAPPSQHLVKIKSFSFFSEASEAKYESEMFEAGGYKWSLSIYPTGNKKADGKDHVSIYLVLRDLTSLPTGWEVNAIVNFSAYNFLQDEYVTTQDACGRRFHVLKTEWGIPKFIGLDTFKDPLKGYLIDDTCVLGVESWKFDNFSSAKLFRHESQPFVTGTYKWKIILYPNGDGVGNGNNISLFLALDASTLPPNTKLFVDFTLMVKDQISGQHAKCAGINKFHTFKIVLLTLEDLKDTGISVVG